MRATYSIKETDFVEYKGKCKARNMVKKALKTGEIKKPKQCELCDKKTSLEAHHIDYTKPLEVYWLCDACHGVAHRHGHPLNPSDKVPPLNWEDGDMVHVATLIPFPTFVYLKKLSHGKKIPLAQLLRLAVISQYPVDDKQLYFDLENDNAQTLRESNKRVRSLDEDEESMLQQKSKKLSDLRRQRHPSLPGMERVLCAV